MEDSTTTELDAMASDLNAALADKPARRKDRQAEGRAIQRRKGGDPAKPVKRVSGRDAIAKVLADGQPRSAKEITAAAVKLVRPAMTGKTPEATLGALLYTQAKRPDGLVIKAGSGRSTTFTLRPKGTS